MQISSPKNNYWHFALNIGGPKGPRNFYKQFPTCRNNLWYANNSGTLINLSYTPGQQQQQQQGGYQQNQQNWSKYTYSKFTVVWFITVFVS